LLDELGYTYAEVALPSDVRSRVLGAVTGAMTVPQVFFNGQHIGGWEELAAWARKAA
jgi:glutaredoxin